jgi:hypothetical protein
MQCTLPAPPSRKALCRAVAWLMFEPPAFLKRFKLYKDGESDADEQIGVNILRRALEEPVRLIAQNAGREGAVVVERVRAERTGTLASTR